MMVLSLFPTAAFADGEVGEPAEASEIVPEEAAAAAVEPVIEEVAEPAEVALEEAAEAPVIVEVAEPTAVAGADITEDAKSYADAARAELEEQLKGKVDPGFGEQKAYADAVDAINAAEAATNLTGIESARISGLEAMAAARELDQYKADAVKSLTEAAQGDADALAIVEPHKKNETDAICAVTTADKNAVDELAEAAKAEITAILTWKTELAEALEALDEAKSVNAGARELAELAAAKAALNALAVGDDIDSVLTDGKANLAAAKKLDDAMDLVVAKQNASAGTKETAAYEATVAAIEALGLTDADTAEATAKAEIAKIEAAAEEDAADAKELAEAKTAAKKDISDYADELTDLFETLPTEVAAAVEDAKKAIDEAETVADVSTVESEQLLAIEAVALPIARELAIAGLEEMADSSENVQEALLNAKIAIEEATSIDELVAAAEAAVAAIEAEQEANALAVAKEEAKAAIDEAKTVDEVEDAQEAGVAAVAAGKLADDKAAAIASLTVSEVPGEAEKAAIEEAKAAIEDAAADTLADVVKAEQEKIDAAKKADGELADAQKALAAAQTKAKAAIDLALSDAGVEADVQTYKDDIDAIEVLAVDQLESALAAVDSLKADALAYIESLADLDAAYEAAVKKINDALPENPTARMTKTANDALKAVEEAYKANDIEAVKAAGEEGAAAVDALRLPAEQEAAQAELDALYAEDTDPEEPDAAVKAAYDAAADAIAAATSTEEAWAAIDTYKADVELLNAKNDALDQIAEIVGEEPSAELEAAGADAENAVNAATLKTINEVLAKQIELLNKVKEFDEYKAAAKAELDAYVEQVGGGAGAARAAAAAQDEIDANKVTAASTEKEVAAAKKAVDAAVAAGKKSIDAELELDAYRETAKAELDAYLSENADHDELAALEEAKNAIDEAEDELAIDAAKLEGKKAMQAARPLDAVKKAAKEKVNGYVKANASDDELAAAAALCAAIDEAASEEEINAVLDGAVEAIAAGRVLGTARASAVAELEAAAKGHDSEDVVKALEAAVKAVSDPELTTETAVYAAKDAGLEAIEAAIVEETRAAAIEAVKAEAGDDASADVKAALNTAVNAIKAAKTTEDIEEAEAAGLESIQAAKELVAAKEAAKAELEAYKQTENASDDLLVLIEDSIDEIDTARNLEAVEAFKKAAIEAFELQIAKDGAIAELNDAAVNENGVVTDEVQAIVDSAAEKINAVEVGEKAIETISKLKNDAIEAILKQQAEDGDILAAAKSGAINELKLSKEPGKNESAAYDEAVSAITAAADIDAVNAAKAEGQEKIDAAKALDEAIADGLKAIEDELGEEAGADEQAVYDATVEAIKNAASEEEVEKLVKELTEKLAAAKACDEAKAEAYAAIEELAGPEESRGANTVAAVEAARAAIAAAATEREVGVAQAEETEKVKAAIALDGEIAAAKEEAKAAIDEALPEDASDELKAVADEAVANIEAAESVEAVEAAKEEGIQAIADQIAAEELAAAKEEAIAAINEAAGENPSGEVAKVAAEQIDAVNAAESVEDVKAAQEAGVAAVEAKIADEDAAAEAEAAAKALEAAKATAAKVLNSRVGEDASEAEKAALEDALAAVEAAASEDEVTAAMNDGIDAIAEAKAADAAEKEAAEKLAVAKEEAKAAIDEAAGENPSDKVKAAAEEAKAAIDAAETVEEVEAAQAEGEESIAEAKKADDPIAAFVERMYTIALDRASDAQGLADWTKALTEKTQTGATVANNFIGSPEFASRGLDNGTIVDIVYAVMLDREPDEQGRADWVKFLDAGCTPSFLVNGFAGSDEFKKICAEYGIDPGSLSQLQPCDQNPNITLFVSRCYETVLGRKGDAQGINDWCAGLISKTYTPQQCAENFVFSQEAINKNLSNTEFVKMLYRVYMGREADEESMAGWVAALDNGSMTRQAVSAGFAGSAEFANIVASYGL